MITVWTFTSNISALNSMCSSEWPCQVCASSFKISQSAEKKNKLNLGLITPALVRFLSGAGSGKGYIPHNVIVMLKA